MGKDDNLQQFEFIGFIIQKFPQDFQTENRDFLTFINNQNRGFIVIDAAAIQVLLDILFDLPVINAFGGLFAREHFRYRNQKFVGIDKMRVQDQMRIDFFAFGKSADDLPAQRCFAGNHIQPAAQ